MSRTNIDIDDDLIAEVMRRFHRPTKKSAVEFALRRLLVDEMSLVELVDSLAGVGWEDPIDPEGEPAVEEFEIDPRVLAETERSLAAAKAKVAEGA